MGNDMTGDIYDDDDDDDDDDGGCFMLMIGADDMQCWYLWCFL